MTWALDLIAKMMPEEKARSPMLCVSDTDFDEIERLLDTGRQARDLNGDRFLKHEGATIYTHYANRKAGKI